MKKRKKCNKYKSAIIFLLVVIMFLVLILVKTFQSFGEKSLSLEEYPKELIDLMERNPETREFVLNYPIRKDCKVEVNIDVYKDCSEVPLLMQWDEQWGYSKYGDSIMGLNGCGPTCLSMVSVYLLNDTTYHPRYIADFSEENGYCVPGNGSAWTLISEGGKELGLNVEELSLDEQKIVYNLEKGNPIICIMGPGDFTTTGHFIVLTDYEDGQLKINDPNSRANSNKLWNFEEIQYQIRNLWVCSK